MRVWESGPLVPNGSDDVDEAAPLASFWHDVTRKIRLNYPDLSDDDVLDQLSALLFDVQAAARKRAIDACDAETSAAAISLVREACSDAVARHAGEPSRSRSTTRCRRPLERRREVGRLTHERGTGADRGRRLR